MSNTVLITTESKVRTLTLNRPDRLNAINDELLKALGQALEDANSDPEVRAIVLQGAGRAFCAGDDLKDFENQSRSEGEAVAFIESIQDITRKIVFGKKFVIGAIHGWAVGGGLEWAINCDLAVLAHSTRCFFPELKWGMFPTGGITYLLPRMIGPVKTRELILFGEKFGPNEALEMGFAWRVVADILVNKTATAAAKRIAELPPDSVDNLKQVLNQVNASELNEAMRMETEATVRSFLDPETTERVRSFNE